MFPVFENNKSSLEKWWFACMPWGYRALIFGLNWYNITLTPEMGNAFSFVSLFPPHFTLYKSALLCIYERESHICVCGIWEYTCTWLNHDDVIKWKHFRGFPSQSQWRGALTFSLICAWTNGYGNNGDAGDLRRHRAHYHVTVMTKIYLRGIKRWIKRVFVSLYVYICVTKR